MPSLTMANAVSPFASSIKDSVKFPMKHDCTYGALIAMLNQMNCAGQNVVGEGTYDHRLQ